MRRRLYSLSLYPLVLCLSASCWLFPAGGSGSTASYSECADPEAREAWGLAKIEVRQGRDAKALPLLRIVTSKCPVLLRAHIAYQDVAKRLGGEHEQAMVDFYVKAPERAPGDRSPVPAYLRARLAETAYAQSNALDQILASDGTFAWGYLSRGRVNRGQGRLSEALQNYDEAISNDAELLEARLERAQVLTELGRDEEAAVEYKTYVGQAPSDSVAVREYITLLLYGLARIDEAIDYLDLLEQRGEKSLSLRMDRAAAQWRAKQPQAAAETYLEILAAEPTTARAALNIGLLYYEIVPQDEAAKLRFWPKARSAFELFLQRSDPADGHEQFEQTWAVPFRLRRIGELLGPSTGAAKIEDLAWPAS
ncbi:MAG: tetratricopeptide (TPR) repeat protein [Planctomycetota bacterium]|jgi:tetratricopeptide (TPR) repeat protein